MLCQSNAPKIHDMLSCKRHDTLQGVLSRKLEDYVTGRYIKMYCTHFFAKIKKSTSKSDDMSKFISGLLYWNIEEEPFLGKSERVFRNIKGFSSTTFPTCPRGLLNVLKINEASFSRLWKIVAKC